MIDKTLFVLSRQNRKARKQLKIFWQYRDITIKGLTAMEMDYVLEKHGGNFPPFRRVDEKFIRRMSANSNI